MNWLRFVAMLGAVAAAALMAGLVARYATSSASLDVRRAAVVAASVVASLVVSRRLRPWVVANSKPAA